MFISVNTVYYFVHFGHTIWQKLRRLHLGLLDWDFIRSSDQNYCKSKKTNDDCVIPKMKFHEIYLNMDKDINRIGIPEIWPKNDETFVLYDIWNKYLLKWTKIKFNYLHPILSTQAHYIFCLFNNQINDSNNILPRKQSNKTHSYVWQENCFVHDVC